MRKRDFLTGATTTLLVASALGIRIGPMVAVPIPTTPLSDREAFLRDFAAFIREAYRETYGLEMQPFQIQLAADMALNNMETT